MGGYKKIWVLSSLAIFFLSLSLTVYAEPDLADFRFVRLLENDDVFDNLDKIPGLEEGVAFPPGAATVLQLNLPEAVDQPVNFARLGLVQPGKPAASRTEIEISDPINVAFDTGDTNPGLFSMFIYDTYEVTAIRQNPQDFLVPGSIKRFDVTQWGVKNARGMTLDPDSGTLFVLDVLPDRPDLVIIKLGPQRSPMGTSADRVSLCRVVGPGRPRGIAFNPRNGHLYLFIPGTEEIIEVTRTGELVDRLEVPTLDTTDLQGVIFSSSSDGTDNPLIYNLFVVSGGGANGELSEWTLTKSKPVQKPDRVKQPELDF